MNERIAKIFRLARGEALKAFSHPFIYIAFAVILLVVLAATWLQFELSGGDKASPMWRPNAVQIFAYGCKYGVKLVSLFVIIFAGMSFAGEYDKGTIKSLLTRPVTRTDLFLAKALFITLLTAVMLVAVFYLAFLLGLIAGDLGPIWDKENYKIQCRYDKLLDNLLMTSLLCLIPPFTAAFMGIFISNLTESSGYAVAMSLILFSVLETTGGWVSEETAKYIFNFFPDYAFNILKGIAEGKSTYIWDNAIFKLYLPVTLGSLGLFGGTAYLIFRTKNVHA